MARRNNENHTRTAGRRYTASTYTEGNTVRVERPYEVPKREREYTRKEDREAQRRLRQIRRNRDKALQMSPSFLFFVSLAAVCVLFISINYLMVQTSIVSTMTSIETKELELENMKADNDLLEAQIRTYVDLDHIYEVATTELGMVRPDDDQVLYYEKTESEYVRQYESIP